MTQSSSLNRAPGANIRILSRPALPVAALALGMLLCSVAAQADGYSSSGAAFTPSYIALNLGTADLSRPITAFGVFGGQQQGQAHGLAIGNYFSGTNYGIEASYADLGSVTRYGGDTKVDGINFSLIGRMPVSDTFNVLGKIGTTYSRTTVTTDSDNSALAGSERGFDEVQLSGFVDNQAQIDHAIDLTQAIPGVRAVANKMAIKK